MTISRRTVTDDDNAFSVAPVAPGAAWPPKAAFLQFRVRFADFAANLAVVRERLTALAPPPSTLVVLPELWSCGFAGQALARQAAQTPDLLAALTAEARRYRSYLAGSLPEAPPPDGSTALFYNTLYLVGPEGVVGSYRKQRLFAPMGEPDYFRPGAGAKAGPPAGPITAPWGPVGALVCFDLRFPELAAAQARGGADLLLVSAQWPLVRREHWRVLLRARAIENQLFVVACNTCGRVGDTDFAGSSMIIAPDGEVLVEAGEAETSLGTPLDFSRLAEARRLFRTVGGGSPPGDACSST